MKLGYRATPDQIDDAMTYRSFDAHAEIANAKRNALVGNVVQGKPHLAVRFGLWQWNGLHGSFEQVTHAKQFCLISNMAQRRTGQRVGR